MLRRSRSHRGQGLAEYGLLIAMILGILVLVVPTIGLGYSYLNSSVSSSINGAIGGGGGDNGGGGNNPTPTPNGTAPTGYATDVYVGDGTSLVSGTHWAPNAVVTVTYGSGPKTGTELGYFTVGVSGDSSAYTPMYVNLDAGAYTLLFTSGAKSATYTLNVSATPIPWAAASDTSVGGTTLLDVGDFAANANITVTYTSGPDSGQTLGTFQAGADGSTADSVPMVVDSGLTPGSYNLLFSAGSQTAPAVFNIYGPTGSASEAYVGGTTVLAGSYWAPNTTVTVAYTSGPDSGQTLGTFTVDVNGNYYNYSVATTIAPNLDIGTYSLSFTSGSDSATNTLNVVAAPLPSGYAYDTHPGGITYVGGGNWAPNATITVTYVSGSDNTQVLGSFTVGANGNTVSEVPMAVDPNLAVGTYNLSFDAGAQHADATLTLDDTSGPGGPWGWASYAYAGGNTQVSGSAWASNATVTVTYTDGADSGQVLGTFTVGPDGNNISGVPMAVDPALTVGTYALSFDSHFLHATGTLTIIAPSGWASDTAVGGETQVTGGNWLANSTVTVSYASGPDNGTVLGTFTVGNDGNSIADTALAVDPALAPGPYDLSFDSAALHASASFNINGMNGSNPQGWASDARVGGTTHVGGANWPPSATVTVTFTSGPKTGTVLGTFAVGTNGNSANNVAMAVDPIIPLGSYNLSFSSGFNTATGTLNIMAPIVGSITGNITGGMNGLGGPLCASQFFPPNDSGSIWINGSEMGTWTSDADGNLSCGLTITPAPTTPAEVPGPSTCAFTDSSGTLTTIDCNFRDLFIFKPFATSITVPGYCNIASSSHQSEWYYDMSKYRGLWLCGGVYTWWDLSPVTTVGGRTLITNAIPLNDSFDYGLGYWDWNWATLDFVSVPTGWYVE